MEYTLKLAIIGICLLFLGVGIAIGHLSTYLTLRSMRNKEEYLFNLRMKHETDTIRIIMEANAGPGIPGTEDKAPLVSTTVVSGAHRMPSPSLLARQREYPLQVGAPIPNHKTLIWDRLSVQPISEG